MSIFFIPKHVRLDEMRQITRAAKNQENRLRADLREVQRKLEAEHKYAEKVRGEREELRQVIQVMKKQKLDFDDMEAKVKTLEADADKQAEDLKVQVTDAIQRAVERCTRKYVDSLDSCFPGATYIFSCEEDDPRSDARHSEAASQDFQSSVAQKMTLTSSAVADDDLSVSSKN